MRENRPWIIWLTIAAVMLAGVGVFFYYNFFRQSKSELIEAIPTDAAFIFALNDNDGFVSATREVTPFLNELFVMDALPAYETMRGKLPTGEYDLTVSGHVSDEGVSVLFNMHADKAAFKRLLRALSIDPNNYISFEGSRIYTYGTNFKSMKFVYINHIISISPDVELLKRAIVQHAHPKDLLSDKQFKEMYDLTEKNRKQNWLIINPERYTPYLSSFLTEDLSKKLSNCLKEAGWTALQLRFSGNEMFLSGYARQKDTGSGNFMALLGKQAKSRPPVPLPGKLVRPLRRCEDVDADGACITRNHRERSVFHNHQPVAESYRQLFPACRLLRLRLLRRPPRQQQHRIPDRPLLRRHPQVGLCPQREPQRHLPNPAQAFAHGPSHRRRLLGMGAGLERRPGLRSLR